MNADTFDSHSSDCPICHRTSAIEHPKLIAGLLTCPHCRTRLVVSWSGHYVRDPFTLRYLATEKMLRRESHPLARIARDFRYAARPVLLAVLGTAVFIGTSLLLAQTSPLESHSPSQEGLPTLNKNADDRSSH